MKDIYFEMICNEMSKLQEQDQEQEIDMMRNRIMICIFTVQQCHLKKFDKQFLKKHVNIVK